MALVGWWFVLVKDGLRPAVQFGQFLDSLFVAGHDMLAIDLDAFADRLDPSSFIETRLDLGIGVVLGPFALAQLGLAFAVDAMAAGAVPFVVGFHRIGRGRRRGRGCGRT